MKGWIKWIAGAGVIVMIAANIIAAVTGGFSAITFILAGIGFVCFLSIAFTGESGNFLSYFRMFLNILFVLGTLIFLYLIAANHNPRKDFTKNRIFSLSPQTETYLKTLDKDIFVTGFTTSPGDMRRFFRQYTRHTDRLKVNVRNPFKDFREAQKLKTEFGEELYPGDVFIRCGDNRKKIRELEEPVFVNALVEVQREKQAVVYFLKGHGEGSLSEPTEEQMNKKESTFHTLTKICDKRGIEVKTLELMRTGEIPEDASVIVSAGPRADLFSVEKEALSEWMEEGGRMILMLDPPSAKSRDIPHFKKLLREFGVTINDEIVIDPNKVSMQQFGLPVVPLVTFYAKHPITKDIPYDSMALFVPMARPINPVDDLPPDITATALLKSSESSWAQPVDEILEQGMQAPEKSEMAPQNLALAVTKSPPGGDENKEGRMVVFGDSDIFTDVNIIYEIPVYLFQNSIAWLMRTSDMIAIPPKVAEETPMTITAAQKEIIAILLIITFPSIILIGGLGYTIIRRRSR